MTAQEWNPEKLLRVSGDYWQTCALHAGVKLGIFTAIGKDCLASSEIAQKIN